MNAGTRPGVSSHVQLLQAQVQQLNQRLGALEVAHTSGQEAIGRFVDRLVNENAKLDARLLETQTATGGPLGHHRGHVPAVRLSHAGTDGSQPGGRVSSSPRGRVIGRR